MVSNIIPLCKATAASPMKPVASIADGTLIIVAGTSNCVTRANKVLTPDSFRSHERFGTEFHGLEIFGEKVFTPEAAVVAYVKLPVEAPAA